MGKGADADQAGGRSQGPRPPLQPRHGEAAGHGLDAAGRRSSRACARPWPGTRRTSGGGARSRSATRPTRPTSKRSTASAGMTSPVLVTGAAGFVGSHLLELLARDGAEIVAWQRPGTEPLVRGAGGALGHRRDARPCVASPPPSPTRGPRRSITWPACRTSATRGSTRARRSRATCSPPHHLFEAIAAAPGCSRGCSSASSATVYTPDRSRDHRGRSGSARTVRTAPASSRRRWSAARAWEDDGIPGLIARAFNHIGPRQSPAFVAPSLARQIALIEAGRLPPVLKVGNLEPKRDLMDVRDTVRAYRAMMQSAPPGVPYNVCTGRAIADRGPGRHVPGTRAVPIRIEQDPARFRPNDTPLVLGDRTRLDRRHRVVPEIPLEQTVDDLLAHWAREDRMRVAGRSLQRGRRGSDGVSGGIGTRRTSRRVGPGWPAQPWPSAPGRSGPRRSRGAVISTLLGAAIFSFGGFPGWS